MEKKEEIKIDYDRINKFLDRLEKLEIRVDKLEHEEPKEPKWIKKLEEHGVFDKENNSKEPFDYENSKAFKIMEEYGVFDDLKVKENDKQIETEPQWIKEWKKHKKEL